MGHLSVIFPLAVLIAFATICSAQQIDVYVSSGGSAQIPVDLDSLSCTEADPCSMTLSGNPMQRYYDGLSINLIFGSGFYYLTTIFEFGTSGDLNVTSLGPVTFGGFSYIAFGNHTHPVGSLTIQNTELALSSASTNTIRISSTSGVLMSNVTATVLGGTSGSYAELALSEGSSLVMEKVTFGFTSGAPACFLILTANVSMELISIVDSTIPLGYNAFFIVAETLSHLTSLEFIDSDFSSASNVPVFQNENDFILEIDEFMMTGCDFSEMDGLLSSIRPIYAHISNNDLAGLEMTFYGPGCMSMEFWYNDMQGNGGLHFDSYAEVDFFANLFVGNGNLWISGVENFWSEYDQFYDMGDISVGGVSGYAVINGAYFSNSKFEIRGAEYPAPEAYVTYSIFEMDVPQTPSSISAVDVYFYESEFYNYANTDPTLVLESLYPEEFNVSIYGDAIIMGLKFEGYDAGFVNYAFLSILNYFSAPYDATFFNSGILAFIAHPDTSAPVVSNGVTFKGAADPLEEDSIIVVVVWKAGESAALHVQYSSFEPSDHFLQVLIENGDLGEPVDGEEPVRLIIGEGLGDSNFSVVYPYEDYEFDTDFNFNGVTSLEWVNGTKAYLFHVSEYGCPRDCSGNGFCDGVNTCNCNPTYSGYSCGCHDLPQNVFCSADADDYWGTNSDLSIDDTSSLEFPDATGCNMNGSLVNNGKLTLKDATYDVTGTLLNNGNLTIISTISMVRNTTVGSTNNTGCVYVPTSRSFAKELVLKTGSKVTVEIDMASAATATCPNGTPSTTNPVFQRPNAQSTRRDAKRDPKGFLAAKRSAFTTSAVAASSSTPVSKAAKSKALLEADSSNVSGGTMVVNLKSAPTTTVEITLLATRNATTANVPLLVEVNAPSGTCTSVSKKNNLVTLFASPCATSPTPETPGAPPNKNATKWYYYGAPIIAVVGIIAIVVVLVLTVPSVREAILPYQGSN